jgi:hypothetical protein
MNSDEYILLQYLWKTAWNSFNDEMLEGSRYLYQSRVSPPRLNMNSFIKRYSWWIPSWCTSLWNSNKFWAWLSSLSSLKLGRCSSQTLRSRTIFGKPEIFVNSKGANLVAIQVVKEIDMLETMESLVNQVESSNQGVAKWKIKIILTYVFNLCSLSKIETYHVVFPGKNNFVSLSPTMTPKRCCSWDYT